MRSRRASHGSARPLNCGVMRLRKRARLCQPTMLAAFMTLACSGGQHSWQGPRVVFSPEALSHLPEAVVLMTRIPPPPYWMPSPSEIESAEAALSRHSDSPSSDFGRQYFGFTIDGRHVVQVRGFCERYFSAVRDPQWERTPVLLLDAGGCAFLANVDTNSGNVRIEWGTAGP
jgi:hypothetical protein